MKKLTLAEAVAVSKDVQNQVIENLQNNLPAGIKKIYIKQGRHVTANGTQNDVLGFVNESGAQAWIDFTITEAYATYDKSGGNLNLIFGKYEDRKKYSPRAIQQEFEKGSRYTREDLVNVMVEMVEEDIRNWLAKTEFAAAGDDVNPDNAEEITKTLNKVVKTIVNEYRGMDGVDVAPANVGDYYKSKKYKDPFNRSASGYYICFDNTEDEDDEDYSTVIRIYPVRVAERGISWGSHAEDDEGYAYVAVEFTNADGKSSSKRYHYFDYDPSEVVMEMSRAITRDIVNFN